MLEVYSGFLIFGIIFAFITLVFDDIVGNALDGVFDALAIDGFDFLNPMVFVGGLTVFGGTGVTLTKYSSLSPNTILIIAILAAIVVSVLVFFVYIKPMKNSENSTGYSIFELSGKIAEVITSIPLGGYGEVLVKAGVANTNQIAASFDNEAVPSGTKVVVIEVKESVLYVSRFEKITKGE